MRTPIKSSVPPSFPRCISCKCKDCDQIKKLIIKKLDVKKVNEVTAETSTMVTVILFNQDVVVEDEVLINYSYTDLGRHMIILDICAPLSLAGVSQRV